MARTKNKRPSDPQSATRAKTVTARRALDRNLAMLRSPADRWFFFLEQSGIGGGALSLTLLFVMYVRWAVALNPYSGAATPPMYGDYEAQRHWMELTLHVPISQCLHKLALRPHVSALSIPSPHPVNPSTHPASTPLLPHTHSGSWINPAWFALDASHGYESANSKFYMRATVILFEGIVYIPAVIGFVNRWNGLSDQFRVKTEESHLVLRIFPAFRTPPHSSCFSSPPFSSSITVTSSTFPDARPDPTGHQPLPQRHICPGRPFLLSLSGLQADGSVLFSRHLCLPSRQVLPRTERVRSVRNLPIIPVWCHSPYYALPHLTASPTPIPSQLLFLRLGGVVIGTFSALLSPWLTSSAALLQVAHRVFPLARGLYEDKVANMWCAASVVIKLKEIFDVSTCMRLRYAGRDASSSHSNNTCLPPIVHQRLPATDAHATAIRSSQHLTRLLLVLVPGAREVDLVARAAHHAVARQRTALRAVAHKRRHV
ncbi:hypothetical protein BC938DRAFT_477858 [Jimgerdemannia flammicorona]|uniref:Alpha-1,3-glucosyltransferase n=1 Tax=Jimgerdemannia flammicorona TaxID=994334 RepID=A0A433QNT4_9FUNG|nr:hypothetical protein BC938DRAFT_477858 [Jimgerdemannia flammicorona]